MIETPPFSSGDRLDILKQLFNRLNDLDLIRIYIYGSQQNKNSSDGLILTSHVYLVTAALMESYTVKRLGCKFSVRIIKPLMCHQFCIRNKACH